MPALPGGEHDQGAGSQPGGGIILYDDQCGLCALTTSKIRRHDRSGLFALVGAHSAQGVKLCQQLGCQPENLNSIVYVKGNVILRQSDAVLAIAVELGGWWKWLGILRFIPKPIRDRCYALIARHRHRLLA